MKEKKKHHSKILTDEQIDVFSRKLKELSDAGASLKQKMEAVKSTGFKIGDDWYDGEKVVNAITTINDFQAKSFKSGNNETFWKLQEVGNVISTAASVYFKAVAYEIMVNDYRNKIIEKDKELLKISKELEMVKSELDRNKKIDEF